ncbi:uncharacterized protein STEHIDRAFT_117225 [Stereum hirsutum FP-91666 SS1]|uniref:uncharacterized protein n=1 Tax=Stereum hirsutum (strain FP-91666) TaxID=721885 RepID=UPI000440C2EC|nr:uncharacterized protein STEHIDRAFT_117225 [Stereum hirsutum FP-91666 SS1]EIM92139.1 hypothetical protein STEHIDRAFT_117225 [Stereum hirsutum FP-91666 SS1]
MASLEIDFTKRECLVNGKFRVSHGRFGDSDGKESRGKHIHSMSEFRYDSNFMTESRPITVTFLLSILLR